jgi:superfamily II DNA or RNA helicase
MTAARVIVDSRIRVLLRDVPEDLRAGLRQLFEHRNPQHEKLKHLGFRFDHRKEPRLIVTWRDEPPWLSLPRGGMGRLREHLAGAGVVLRVRDERTEGDYAPPKAFRWRDYARKLYPHQEEALEAILALQNCYLRAPTGSGKTSVGLALIARVRLPAIVIVWTGALFDQWMERVGEELQMQRRFIGQIRGGKKTVGPVTVAMQQTLAKLPKNDPVFEAFGVVEADELQRWSSATFIRCIDAFRARYRIGMSADERRADKKEFLAHDEFGDLALSIDRKALVAEKRVRDVEIRVVPTGWESPVDPEVGSAGDQYREMLDAMAVATQRDEHVVRIIAEERARGEQILVFSLRVEHCVRLVGLLSRSGIAAGLMLGGAENRAALTEAVAGLRARTMMVGVGTVQAVGTGVDLPSVGVGIAAMPVAGNRQLFGQVAGRVCRIAGGEGAARLYVLADPCRLKDWPAYFEDGRPVFVRAEGGGWIDARREKRRAKQVAFPLAASSGTYPGDELWRQRR